MTERAATCKSPTLKVVDEESSQALVQRLIREIDHWQANNEVIEAIAFAGHNRNDDDDNSEEMVDRGLFEAIAERAGDIDPHQRIVDAVRKLAHLAGVEAPDRGEKP